MVCIMFVGGVLTVFNFCAQILPQHNTTNFPWWNIYVAVATCIAVKLQVVYADHDITYAHTISVYTT